MTDAPPETPQWKKVLLAAGVVASYPISVLVCWVVISIIAYGDGPHYCTAIDDVFCVPALYIAFTLIISGIGALILSLPTFPVAVILGYVTRRRAYATRLVALTWGSGAVGAIVLLVAAMYLIN